MTDKNLALPPANAPPAALPEPAALPVSDVAQTLVEAIRARYGAKSLAATGAAGERPFVLPQGLAQGFLAAPGGFRPRFRAAEGRATAKVVLPEHSAAPLHVEDTVTGMVIDIVLKDARRTSGQVADGYVIYPQGHASGATLLHRPLLDGVEDFLNFQEKPTTPSIGYQVQLKAGVAGLRLIANTVEFLDEGGAPRLRINPPYLVGSDGVRTDARLTVTGCAVDQSPAAPWGRRVTHPGAGTCTVRVGWQADAVAYPAVLDPHWSNTGNMVSARQDHTATLLSTGKVLVAGGRTTNTGTVGLATAELFDRTTGTWAATASMTGGRWSHTAVQLGTTASTTTSGKVLVAGGINGTTSQNTAQLYSASAGTWVAAGNLNAPRHLHTATVLANGQVFVAGGMNGTAVLNSAALYNPASGAGTWTGVTATMSSSRRSHTATLLVVPGNTTLNNKVLIVGGNSGGTTSLGTVQLFDGVSAWTTLAALPALREGHTATALANGNVLITGGRTGTTTLDTTLLFNAASGTGSWASAGTMTVTRQAHTATLLSTSLVNNGQILVIGGSNGTAAHGTAELWNGATTWTSTTGEALNAPAQGHTATLLASGAVLIAGGINSAGTINLGQIYDPSFAVACTSNSQCATGFCANGVCCATTCTGTCSSCNLAGKVGTCSPLASGTVCRSAAGVCDLPETCNGTVLTCPADSLAPATTTCRAAVGACDTAETCTGTSAACPADAFKANGTVCNDANACTTGETCQTGVCGSGTAVTCTGADACHTVGACVPATGCPAPVAKAAGTSCADANLCNGTETCNASGACVAGTPLTCTGADACHTVAACVPATGCPAPVAKAVGTSCADANLCNGTETCNASGACVAGTPLTCTGADACHTVGACVPATGCPAPVAKAAGTSCADANLCNGTETCNASGVCVAGTGLVVDDGNPCTVDSCDPITGVKHTAVANWTPCADTNLCDGLETCQAGVCQHETPGGATTCSGGTRVTFYQSFDHGTKVDIAASSDTAREPNPLVQVPGLFGLAEDASTYTWISYATTTQTSPTNIVLSKPGSVSMWVRPNSQFTPATFFESFDNDADLTMFVSGNAAGVTATFAGGADNHFIVGSTAPWTADDRWHLIVVNWSRYGIACSVDGAAPVLSSTTGLLSIPFAINTGNLGNLIYPMAGATGYAKDELIVLNRPMTITDIQWYYSQRLTPTVPNPAIARFTGDPTDCNPTDDLNPCTADACSPSGGVTHAPVAAGTSCNDGNACTQNDVCQGTTCAGQATVGSDDGNPCTVDSCDSLLGVLHVAAADWTTCSDGNVCNGLETCHQGACVAEVPGTATTCGGGGQVTFYQNFGSTTATVGVSDTAPRTNTPFVQTPGIFGLAMDGNASPNADLSYQTDNPAANPTNLAFSKPGSLSMWIKARSQYQPTTYFVGFDTNFKMVIGDNGAGVIVTLERQDDGTQYRVQAVSAGPTNWRTDGRWHLIVVNWTAYGLSTSLDAVWSSVVSAPWMATQPFGINRGSLIFAGTPWPSAASDYVKDELIILNRPMKANEVLWYLSQGNVPAAVNPAIDRFNGDPTGCTPWDDLNPCTADACSPSGGVTHAPLAAGTACDDGNACTSGDSCQAGACVGGTTASVDDLNSCTVDSCDPATGRAIHTPTNETGGCSDGNSCTSGDTCHSGVCQPGAVAASCSVQGAKYYAPLIDLGAFGTDTTASGISENGDIVGSGQFPAPPGGPRPHAFRYSDSGGITAVFPDSTWSYGWGVNSSGVVVGGIAAGGNAYSASPGGIPVTYPSWGSANAGSINDNGQIAGYLFPPSAIPQAFRFTPGDSAPKILGTLTGPQFDGGTDGRSVDISGRVVGLARYFASTPPRNWWDQGHATVFTDASGMQDLNTLAAPTSGFATLSVATSTNSSYIVGWGFRNDGSIHAFRFHDGGTVDDLPGFSTGGIPYSAAYGVNAAGTAVGVAFAAPFGGGDHAFVSFLDNQIHDLNTFVDPASGWVLMDATAINSKNEVVGYGSFQNAGLRAFKMKVPDLSPCPATTAQCQGAGTRDPATGLCTYAPLTGTPCTDHNACTQPDTCQAGVCVSGPVVAIDDQNNCTADSCDPGLGPVHAPISEGTACDDGNRCTVNDACHVGVCQPGPATACSTAGATYYAPMVGLRHRSAAWNPSQRHQQRRRGRRKRLLPGRRERRRRPGKAIPVYGRGWPGARVAGGAWV